MRNVLSQIKSSARGVRGLFAMGKDGHLIFSDLEGVDKERMEKAAFDLNFFLENAGGRKIERMQIATEKSILIFVFDGGATIGCISDKDANLGLIYLLLKKALSEVQRSDAVKVVQAEAASPEHLRMDEVILEMKQIASSALGIKSKMVEDRLDAAPKTKSGLLETIEEIERTTSTFLDKRKAKAVAVEMRRVLERSRGG